MRISKIRLLAIIGSQRKNGNCYLLTRTILQSAEVDYEIIQLSEKEIKFCNLCGKCEYKRCFLKDDFNQILEKMKKADGIVFSFPRYFSLPSKFLCFIERLTMAYHFRKYHGYQKIGIKPDMVIVPPFKNKPCCLFVVSATGWMGREPARLVAHEVEGIGMKVIGNILLRGEEIKEVFKDKKSIAVCEKMVRKLLDSINSKNSQIRN